MKPVAELNSENASAPQDMGGQDQVREPSAALSPGSAPTSAAAEVSASGENAGAGGEGRAEPVVPPRSEPSAGAEEKSPAGEVGRDDPADGSLPAASGLAVASSGAGASPLASALAALDRRDYGTAKRLFGALGREDAVEAIDNALAALDRKDYATAQGLFEALAASKPSAATNGPTPPEKRATTATDVIPVVEPENREPAPQADKPKKGGSRLLLLAACLVLLALVGAAFVSSRNGAFATARNQAFAGLASAVDLIKAPLKAIADPSARDEQRSAMRDLNAALLQASERMDRIERETGARLNALGERAEPDSASRLAEITARLDALEKKAAAPPPAPAPAPAPSPDLAALSARLDKLEKRAAASVASGPELAALAAKLDKLEKKAAILAGAAISVRPVSRAQPSAPNALLQGYAVEEVQDGVALVDSRFGSQQVAPGDYLPGAGRVLRIERRGGEWYVLTSNGVIASAPY